MVPQVSLEPMVRHGLTLHRVGALGDVGVEAVITDRTGGVSHGPYASLNLADHVGDDPVAVAHNRHRLTRAVDREVVFARQVHATTVVDVTALDGPVTADALVLRPASRAVAIMVADCVPLVVVNPVGRRLVAIHAGWRGLAAGVIAAAVAALEGDPATYVAAIGPCVSPARYQVGPEVATQFNDVAGAVLPDVADRSRLDLTVVAAHQLTAAGLDGSCVVSSPVTTDDARFYSDRAARPCGRFALVAWFS